jgi:hypothetical protein
LERLDGTQGLVNLIEAAVKGVGEHTQLGKDLRVIGTALSKDLSEVATKDLIEELKRRLERANPPLITT